MKSLLPDGTSDFSLRKLGDEYSRFCEFAEAREPSARYTCSEQEEEKEEEEE